MHETIEEVATIATAVWRFVVSLSRHPVQATMLALGVGPVLNLGRTLGFPLLYWHERSRDQAKAGAATTLFVASVAFVVCLLESGWEANFSSALRELLEGIGWLWLLVLGATVAWRATRYWQVDPDRATSVPASSGLAPPIRSTAMAPRGGMQSVQVAPWPFAVGSLFAVALVAAGVLGWERASDWLGDVLERHRHVVCALLLLPAEPSNLEPHVLAFLLACLAAGGWLWFARTATPAVAISMTLGLLSAADGYLMFRLRNPLGVALLLVVLLTIGGTNRYRLRLPAFRRYYDSLVQYPPSESAVSDRLLPLAPRKHATGPGLPRPLVVVCTSGGGIRAAAWTAAMLGRLDELPSFREATHLITGASGGMVGATYWTGSLRSHPPGSGVHWTTLLETTAQDSLSALARTLGFRDLPFAFLPCVNERNRGQALEDAWHAHNPEWLDVRFCDVRDGERDGRWPSLVFAPVLLEDGRRLIISNVDLRPVLTNEVCGLSTGGRRTVSQSGFHLEEILPDTMATMPLLTAARLASAFPYSNPAIVLPTSPRRRVGDAGYLDNYGVKLACGWLRECLQREAEWLSSHVSRILIVQIRDSPSELSELPEAVGVTSEASVGTEGPSALASGFDWLLGPVEGLLKTRTAGMIFGNDADIETLTELFAHAHGPGFVQTTTLELHGEVSFSWYLTRAETTIIRDEAASPRIERRLDDVAMWLASDP